MSENGKFDMHCIVELFGHSQIAGKVTEQSIGGSTFLRVDVPKTPKRDGFTKFYGAGAIYAITPVEEKVAAAMAEAFAVEPVSEWRLRNLLDKPALVAPHPDREDWASSREWPEEDKEDESDEAWTPSPVGPVAVVGETAEGAPLTDAYIESDEPDFAEDKRKAAAWARDLLKGEFVIFDTETTGFEFGAEIVQIGIIDHTGAVVLERLIKPTQPVPNADYHGITDEMLANAPGFPEVYEQIKLALENKTVVAYNAEYDVRMLSQDCRRHQLATIPFTDQCAMQKYAQFNGEWNDYHGNYRWKKLREALAAFGLKHEDFGTKEHDACTDARATLAVLNKMAEFGVDAAKV